MYEEDENGGKRNEEKKTERSTIWGLYMMEGRVDCQVKCQLVSREEEGLAG